MITISRQNVIYEHGQLAPWRFGTQTLRLSSFCCDFRARLGRQNIYTFKRNDKTFKFQRHISTEPTVIVSWLIDKALAAEFITSRKMLIVTTRWSKARKCENYKDSFRFTWCNCWFKEGFSLWIRIAFFILRWKLLQAWSKTWIQSAEHKVRQCSEFCRCLEM